MLNGQPRAYLKASNQGKGIGSKSQPG